MATSRTNSRVSAIGLTKVPVNPGIPPLAGDAGRGRLWNRRDASLATDANQNLQQGGGLQLISNDYIVIKERFVDWLKLPPGARDPATLTAFAEANGCTRKVLHAWKRDPDVKKAVASEILGLLTVDDVTKAMFVLKEKAFGGSVSALQALIKMSGLDMSIDSDDESELDTACMSEAELRSLAAIEDG